MPTNFRSIINHSDWFSDWPKAYSAIPQPRPTLLWISQKSDPITVYNLMLSVPFRSYSISPSKVTLETSYFYCNGFRFVDRKYGRPIVKYGRPITIEQSTNHGLLSIDCHISRLSVDIATWDTWSTQDTSFGVKNNLSQNLLSACEFCDVYSFFKGWEGSGFYMIQSSTRILLSVREIFPWNFIICLISDESAWEITPGQRGYL